mgnify:FL=1
MIYKDLDLALQRENFQDRILGLDLGTKTIGISLSDSSRLIASPFDTIIRKKTSLDIDQIIRICTEFNISGLILGFPLNMNSSEGVRVQSTISFAKEVEKKTRIPIIWWDERLSTSAAEKILISADVSREKRKKLIDKMAATYILQGALDRINFIGI